MRSTRSAFAFTLTSLITATLVAIPCAYGSTATGVQMEPVTRNGYELVDAQYMSFVGNASFHYPDDVLWGFNNASASAAAKACAASAYEQLLGLFNQNAPLLREVVRLGATPRFYLWINDYTASTGNREIRHAGLWHWGSDYTIHEWEWEVSVFKSGTCELPTNAEVQAALRTAYSVLRR